MTRLEVTTEEAEPLSSTLDWMKKYMQRLSLDPIGRPYSVSLDNRLNDIKKIDEVIAGAMDRLRPVIKQDFFEKMYDMVCDQADTHDGNMVILWARMSDTFKYVTSISKRLRGNPFKSLILDNISRTELKSRGLWKK